MDTYSGTTMNTDPFIYGTGHMYDGMYTENMIKNAFRGQNMKGRMIYGTENNEILKYIADYIKKYGLVRTKNLCTISGLRSEHIKYLLTYRYPVYETDNGMYLGMLDDNMEPYEISPEPEVLPKYDFSKKLENRLVAYDNGQEIYFTSQRHASRYYKVDPSVIQRMINSIKPRTKKMMGIRIEWLKNQHDSAR